MRVAHIVFLVVFALTLEAAASPKPGSGNGGGGRLGRVSSGIAGATSAGSGGGGGGKQQARDWAVPCSDEQYRRRIYDGLCVRRCREGEVYRAYDGACLGRTVALVLTPGPMIESEAQTTPSGSRPTARVAGYLGAQKVFESDGAISFELAVSDRWLRLAGSLIRFYERQADRPALTLTMPSLALGVRISDSNATRVYLEAGAVGAITKHDPMMDSSITGFVGGMHVEHSLSSRTTLIGAAKLMQFQDDVRATSARAGVRYRHVQASFSVLDFNVGPALYGPELGVAF
jgi:hypothetical protein